MITLWVAIAALVGLTLSAVATETNPIPGLINFPLEYVWRKAYLPAEGSKAIAFAANGAYGVAWAEATQDAADHAAMDRCTNQSKFLSLRKPTTPDCRLLAQGSNWLVPSLSLDPAWQTAAPGKDKPLLKGRKALVPGGKSKGLILFVHGCNGLGDRIFTDVWGRYFTALGFDFYAPDSFADKRPKDVCGTVYEHDPQQVSAVWRLRIAQTQRTIASLKAANPGKPVYLFGHSEGGLIVQMIDAELAGIIVAGEECGVLGAPVAAPPDVPMLYLWGEYDRFVNGMGFFKVTSDGGRNCSSVVPGGRFSFRILAGRTHIPWPWIEDVNNAIVNMLAGGQPPHVAKISPTQKLESAWKRSRQPRRYRSAKPHRAAAINAAGISYFVWGLDNAEDAGQLALFGCDVTASKKINVFRTGKHLCSLMDVNGKVPN